MDHGNDTRGMLDPALDSAMHGFQAPHKTLGDLPAEMTASVIAAASDVALVLDSDGVIRDIACGGNRPVPEAQSWIGQAWRDVVTVESRGKVDDLLKGASENGSRPRWRQVNHPTAKGPDLPIRYCTLRVQETGQLIAIGRDLRDLASLQQQLVEAQLSMEREYARLRHTETRYRLLFQIATEAVLIVEAPSLRVAEANPAALALLDKPARRIVGRTFPDIFDSDQGRLVHELLMRAQFAGRADSISATVSGEGKSVSVSASVFRQDGAVHFLVRLVADMVDGPQAQGAARITDGDSRLLRIVGAAPDGFVMTDSRQTVLAANPAFLDMVQVASEDQVRGEPLSRWIGRSEVDLGLLASNLLDHGSVRLFATTLKGEFGGVDDVEISGVAVPDSSPPCFGLVIRNVARRLGTPAKEPRMAESVEHLTELVGRVPLKKLVQETTDIIERLCIEAALQLTADNRASAAEMLGLSRQSLYVKLRRYGLTDASADDTG